jgi:hypothetical protein
MRLLLLSALPLLFMRLQRLLLLLLLLLRTEQRLQAGGDVVLLLLLGQRRRRLRRHDHKRWLRCAERRLLFLQGAKWVLKMLVNWL